MTRSPRTPRFATLSRMLSRFGADERGAMSVEFALVMPIMLFALAGGVAFYTIFQSYNETSKVAYVVNDIMSRHQTVTNTEMSDLMNLQQRMLPPRVRERALRVSSICFAGGSYKVLWSWSSHTVDTVALPQLTTADLAGVDPTQLRLPTLENQESVILTEVRGSWQPRLNIFGAMQQQWYSVLAVRPRFVQIIPHATLNTATTCPT